MPDVHELAALVADELTKQSRSFRVTWAAHDDRSEDRGYPWPELRPTFEHAPDEWAGPTLIMQGPSWAGAGRIRVALMLHGALVPMGEDLRSYPNAPDIGLSADKAPARIAADILRRLWPEACQVANEVRARVAERAEADEARDVVARTLAETLGSRVQYDNMHHESGPRPGASVAVYIGGDTAARFEVAPGGGVRLERTSTLTLEQALAIAEVIR